MTSALFAVVSLFISAIMLAYLPIVKGLLQVSCRLVQVGYKLAPMNNSERQQKFISLAQVFRPSGPVDKGDLFQGRTGQIVQMAQTIVTPGRHGVIYGERGVGKTSLSAVSSEL